VNIDVPRATRSPCSTARVPIVPLVGATTRVSRDARLLSQAGYRLTAATPIDQFLWSGRLESVSTFTR